MRDDNIPKEHLQSDVRRVTKATWVKELLQRATLIEILSGFLTPTRLTHRLGHDSFLPHSFQFIIAPFKAVQSKILRAL
jgi:hypothetical protein